MKKEKAFDCVAVKNQIQARHRAEWEGLTDEEIRRRVRERLGESNDPVARKWRQLERQPAVTR
jgi:hypothetical protein